MKPALTDRRVLWMLYAVLTIAAAAMALLPERTPDWVKTLLAVAWLLSALLGTVLGVAAAINGRRDSEGGRTGE